MSAPDLNGATRSTQAFVLWTGGAFVGLTLVFVIVDALLFQNPDAPSRGAAMAWMLAFFGAVGRYRKPEWRQAVAPEHAAGLGLVGVLGLWAWPFLDPVVDRPLVAVQYLLLVVVTAIPGTLLVMAIREIRKRHALAGERGA